MKILLLTIVYLLSISFVSADEGEDNALAALILSATPQRGYAQPREVLVEGCKIQIIVDYTRKCSAKRADLNKFYYIKRDILIDLLEIDVGRDVRTVGHIDGISYINFPYSRGTAQLMKEIKTAKDLFENSRDWMDVDKRLAFINQQIEGRNIYTKKTFLTA